ncbi:Protein CBG07689 [Caenorhabditis briggsae]|uniref:CWH43-like N-terminal domain-containing protein n=2 Tax=Caenorhabditis briggsae TaxID=6238 RepID=A0AAE8ZTY7_CAEBR|nr:Protein CBG07689 [Caenorhabditis briggsae]ULT84468.1 hypothetical protein L3Y34_013264 [Caenorhabditis briggsae]UMM43709.1 hypothetical protein L5515_019106 [Caenorhabditis briggsae]CAP27464.1 Protein CBG07689 [Caenorhabditis briggsae]
MLGLGRPPLGFGPVPTFIGLIFAVQMIIVYVIAVLKKDVDAVLPYISSAANKQPQSCIFAMGANISSLLIAVMVHVRQTQIDYVLNTYDDDWRAWKNKLFCVNTWASLVGYISAFGLFIVANVQETAIIPLHITGALLAFGGFTIFMIFQCYLTHKFTGVITVITVFRFRLVFTVLSAIFFVVGLSFGIIASRVFHSVYPDLPTPRPWSRKIYQPGYGYHQISAAAEWLCAFSQIIFMQSFTPEFEDIYSAGYIGKNEINSAEPDDVPLVEYEEDEEDRRFQRRHRIYFHDRP